MADVSRVEWTQGLFLRPEHFQQQERFLESQRRRQARLLHPHGWGIASIGFDADVRRCVALTRVAGILADGTVFDSALEPCLPASLPLTSVPDPTKGQVVYLALARAPDDGPSVGSADGGGPERRYAGRDVAVVDVSSTHGVEAPRPPDERIGVAVPNLRLVVDERSLEDCEHVAIARVLSLDADGAPVFDEGFAPTCVTIAASGLLVRRLGTVRERLEGARAALRETLQRARPSEEDAAGGTAHGPPPLSHPALPLAAALARHARALHEIALAGAHPQGLHGRCAELVAELGALDPSAPDPAVPDYDHVRPAAWAEPLSALAIASLDALETRFEELAAPVAASASAPPPTSEEAAPEPERPRRRGIEVPLR